MILLRIKQNMELNQNLYPYNLLTNYFLVENKISPFDKYTIEEIDANQLITPYRIDLMAKLLYIKFKINNLNSDFGKKVYIDHIKAFTNRTYNEPGSIEKNSIDKYLNDFDTLIYDIKENGFSAEKSLVPVGDNNIILDGSHRVACCIYFHKKVTIIRFKGQKRDFGYSYFKANGMNIHYLDYLITEYCRNMSNTYIACIWPKANDKKKLNLAENILIQSNTIVCKKRVALTYNGLKNLMIQIYSHYDWIGTYKNNHKGIESKAKDCFDSKGNLLVYVLCSNVEQVNCDKIKIRKLFNIANSSIHSTDNQMESIELSEILFNNNSIHFLNHAMPDRYPQFNIYLHQFKKAISKNFLDSQNFVVDSGSVLAAYGIRPSNDFDYLSAKSVVDIQNINGLENHEDQLIFCPYSKDELIYNPEHYFMYQGTKFLTLETISLSKRNRHEKKDNEDIKLIEHYLKKEKTITFYLNSIVITIKGHIRYYQRKIRDIIIHFLKCIKLYPCIHRLWCLIKK